MRRILFILAVLAGIYAFYEQTKPNPNVWISAFGIAVFMLGLLFLNKKTTSNSFSDSDKEEASLLAKRFQEAGFRIWATEGTAKYFEEKGIHTKIGYKIGEEDVNLIDLIQKGKVQYVVNTTTKGKQAERDGFQIRRMSVENGVPCLTSMDTVEAILKVIESMSFKMETM